MSGGAGKTLEPAWVRKADEIYCHCWLYFPRSPKDLNTKTLGNNAGYYLTLAEAKLELATKDRTYLRSAEHAELERTRREYEPQERKKVKVVLPGYDSWKQFANESYGNALDLRAFIFALIGDEASRTELAEFLGGYVVGGEKAASIDLKNELSDYNKTQEVVGVLMEHWPSIEGLTNRTEISRRIRDCLPDEKKAFLREESGKKDSPWKDFCVWVTDIYKRIGLSPGGKGRPRKNGKNGKK